MEKLQLPNRFVHPKRRNTGHCGGVKVGQKAEDCQVVEYAGQNEGIGVGFATGRPILCVRPVAVPEDLDPR
jgi:hypothetical protein